MSRKLLPDDLRGNLCHIAPEWETGVGQKIWFVSAPYGGDVLRFRGEPTSLLYAIAPLIETIRNPNNEDGSGLARLDFFSDIALLNPVVSSQELYVEMEQRLKKQDLRMLCISAMTASSAEGRRIARLAKKINPDTIVVMGGPHEDQATFSTAADPEYREFVDFSIKGDGEDSLLLLSTIVFSMEGATIDEIKTEVMSQERSFSECRGRGGLRFHLDKKRDLLFSGATVKLDDMPLMPRELLCEEDTKSFWMFKKGGKNVKTAQIMTQRGCAWKCTFCSESKRLNFREVDSVLAEVRSVLNFSNNSSGVTREDYGAVFFDDSTFSGGSKMRGAYLKRLYEGLEEFGLEWGCQTRLDQIDSPSLRDMKKAGCSYMFTGMESGNDDMLWSMDKDLTQKDISRGFNAINEVGIRVGVSIVFGAPVHNEAKTLENADTIRETVGFLKKQTEQGNIILISPNVATYYPGSRITDSLFTAIVEQSMVRDTGQTGAEPNDVKNRDQVSFRTPLVNRGYPWNRFEEGEGFHAWNFGAEEAEFALRECIDQLGEFLVSQDLIAIDEIQEAWREGRLDAEGMEYSYLNHASIGSVLDSSHKAAERYRDSGEKGVRDLASTARSKAAPLFGGDTVDKQVVFTRNTTEAASLAFWISGLARKKSPKIVTTSAENLSIFRTLRFLGDHGNPEGRDPWSTYQDYGSLAEMAESERVATGAEIEIVPVGQGVGGSPDQVIIDAVDQSTDLVVFSHVFRDDGYELPVARICREIRAKCPKTKILVDGAQALGTVAPISMQEMGCDFYIATPHKTHGSYPLGLLWMEKAQIESAKALQKGKSASGDLAKPVLMEGMFHQELGLDELSRGSLALPEIASFGAAVDALNERFGVGLEGLDKMMKFRQDLKSVGIRELQDLSDEVEILSPQNGQYAESIVGIRFPGLDNRRLVEHLWRHHGVFVSFIAKRDLIRISIGPESSQHDMIRAVEAIRKSLPVVAGLIDP